MVQFFGHLRIWVIHNHYILFSSFSMLSVMHPDYFVSDGLLCGCQVFGILFHFFLFSCPPYPFSMCKHFSLIRMNEEHLFKLYPQIWINEQHLFLTQVPTSSITYCYQWYCCLFLWVLFRKNSFDQVISEENLGGFHWSVCYNYYLGICGEFVFLLFKLSVRSTMSLNVYSTLLVWVVS